MGLQHNAAFSMKSIVEMSMNRHEMRAALTGDEGKDETALQEAVESWVRRTLWSLVALTSLWDIAITFDRHSELTARLF